MMSEPLHETELVHINDDNYTKWLNPIVDGERKLTGFEGMWMTPEGFAAASPFEEMGIPLLPEDSWDDIIRMQMDSGTTLDQFILDMNIKCTNQKSTSYCWAFATIGCAQVVRTQELGRPCYFSGSSVAAPVKNFNNQGGYGEQAVKFMASKGFNFTADYPEVSTSRAHYTETAKTKALLNRVTLWYAVETFQQAMSCCLAGIPVSAGYNWWRHQIMLTGPTLGAHHAKFRNSWSESFGDRGFGVLEGSKKIFQGAVAIVELQPAITADAIPPFNLSLAT